MVEVPLGAQGLRQTRNRILELALMNGVTLWNVLVYRAAIAECQNLGCQTRQKAIVSQFWRLNVSNQGTSRVVLFLTALGGEGGRNTSLSLLVPGTCWQNRGSLGSQTYHPSLSPAFSLCTYTLSAFWECLSLGPNVPSP